MALNWLRRHQKSVFKPLAVIVVITFVFAWGAYKGKNSGANVSGVRVSIGDRKIGDEEFTRLSRLYTTLNRGRVVPQGALFRQLVRQEIAAQSGVQASPDAASEQVTAIIKDNLGVDSLDEKTYRDYLMQHGVTAAEVHKVISDAMAAEELDRIVRSSVLFSDEEVFLSYRRERQELTFTYAEFTVAEFMDRVEAPNEEEIAAYHKEHSEVDEDAPDALVHPSQYRILYVLADKNVFEKKVKLSPEEISAHYEKLKELRYREDGGDAGDPVYTPFDEVEKEVEENLRKERGRDLSSEAMDAAVKELTEALGNMLQAAEDNPGTPEKELVSLFADTSAKHGLKHGVIDWVTRDGLKSLKSLGNASRMEMYLGETATWSNLIPDVRCDKGRLAASVLGVKPSSPMSLDESRGVIVRKLARSKAVKKAEDEATFLAGAVIGGEKDPSVLDKSYTVQAGELDGKARFLSVGKVGLEPIHYCPDDEHESFRTVQLVSRKMPSRADFDKETFYSRTKMSMLAYIRSSYVHGAYYRYWETKLAPRAEAAAPPAEAEE
ncbi:MAG: SurA N-terminal domain-containing protein [Planctomycetes bacterium]|nr:SurA N-terminal domain-containing protein [Planctomycetota bacterium]